MLKLMILILAFMSLQSCGNLLIDEKVEGSSTLGSSTELSGFEVLSSTYVSSMTHSSSSEEISSSLNKELLGYWTLFLSEKDSVKKYSILIDSSGKTHFWKLPIIKESDKKFSYERWEYLGLGLTSSPYQNTIQLASSSKEIDEVLTLVDFDSLSRSYKRELSDSFIIKLVKPRKSGYENWPGKFTANIKKNTDDSPPSLKIFHEYDSLFNDYQLDSIDYSCYFFLGDGPCYYTFWGEYDVYQTNYFIEDFDLFEKSLALRTYGNNAYRFSDIEIINCESCNHADWNTVDSIVIPQGYYLHVDTGYYFTGDSIYRAGISKLDGSLKYESYHLEARFENIGAGYSVWYHFNYNPWNQNSRRYFSHASFLSDDKQEFTIENKVFRKVLPENLAVDTTYFLRGQLMTLDSSSWEPFFIYDDTSAICVRDSLGIHFSSYARNMGVNLRFSVNTAGRVSGSYNDFSHGDYGQSFQFSSLEFPILIDTISLNSNICELSFSPSLIARGRDGLIVIDNFHVRLPLIEE